MKLHILLAGGSGCGKTATARMLQGHFANQGRSVRVFDGSAPSEHAIRDHDVIIETANDAGKMNRSKARTPR